MIDGRVRAPPRVALVTDLEAPALGAPAAGWECTATARDCWCPTRPESAVAEGMLRLPGGGGLGLLLPRGASKACSLEVTQHRPEQTQSDCANTQATGSQHLTARVTSPRRVTSGPMAPSRH